MRFAEHTKRRRLHWSTKPERRLGPWIIITLIVTVLTGVVSVPPDVAQAQSESQCFSGLRIDAVTVSPHKTRAGVGQVVVEFVIKNDDRSDRSISLRANITDPNDQVVKQWEESSSPIPRKTGIFRFGIPGEYPSSVTWAVPSGSAAGRYSVNVYILSEDKTQVCRRYVYRGAFDVISRDYPWAVAESPAYQVFVKKGSSRTFTVSATDGNNDLSGYQWHVNGVQQVNQPIVAAGFFSSDFEHVFDVVGKSYVRATFVDGGGRNDSVSWEVEVSDLADFCDEESSQVICGYASDWAHDGYEPLDSTISVQLHEPSSSRELSRLEITIQDPYELEAAGYFAVAVPQKAWVEYRGIQKWIQVRTSPGVWSPLSPQQERDAGILDRAGDFILGILLGFVPHGVVTVLSTADFVSSLGEGPRPENAVFRGTYLNCFRQVEMPWIAPEAITGIRISIPVDLVEGDYTALVSRFRAYSLLREGATELGPVEDAFIEIHDPLRSGDREEPPSCERFERTAAETALPATNLGDPTGLTATPGSQGGAVSLSWVPAANATVHRVYLQKEDGTGGRYWSEVLAGDSGTATIAGLEAGQTYHFWVQAGQLLNDSNTHWSAWSNASQAVPTEGSPYSTDREALMAFYNATRGDIWIDNEHWGTESHIRDWYGVNDSSLITDTDKTSDRTVSLELRLNRLSGELPNALGYLTSLKVLEITGHRYTNGNLRGSIPDGLGDLINLEYLDLHGNNLSGKIPSALGKLNKLEYLDLRMNNLRGSIPASMGELTSLEGLDLSENSLTGEIPVSFADLANLEDLYLSGNHLTGCIPVLLRNLHNDDFDEIELPFCDVALSGLTISPGQLEPEFETHTMDYSATVDQSQVTIVPVNDHGATFEYYVGSSRTPATDADPSAPGFKVDLGCGEFSVRIKVISADGEEDESYTVAFTREGGGDIVAPTIGSVSNGAESLTVYWNAPDTSCPGEIDHYNLRYSVDQDAAAWTEVRGPSSGLSHTIRGLTAGTTYRVQAQAVVAGVAGPWSESATGTPGARSTTQRPPPQPGLSADYTVNEGDGSVGIAVTISKSPQQLTQLRLATSDHEARSSIDYSALAILVTFGPNSPLTQTFPITIIDDRTIEVTETFQVHIEKSLGIPLPPGIEEGRYATVAIVDDDTMTVSFQRDQITVNEDGIAEIGMVITGTAMDCAVAIPVDVHFSYTDRDGALPSDSTIPSSLTFDRCDRRGVVPFNVDDVDGDAEVVFTLTRVSSSDASVANRVTIAEPSTVIVTVRDTD